MEVRGYAAARPRARRIAEGMGHRLHQSTHSLEQRQRFFDDEDADDQAHRGGIRAERKRHSPASAARQACLQLGEEALRFHTPRIRPPIFFYNQKRARTNPSICI